MDIIWLVILIALGVAATAGTVTALVQQRAPRTPTDPLRLPELRDREMDREARRLAASIEDRIAHNLDAPGNGLAPQMQRPVGETAIWAATLPAR